MALSGAQEDTSSLYIWIDTLCIPPTENYDESKTKAINRMAFVYAAAMHVLVLDQTVLGSSFQDTSDMAIAVAFLTCPWMSRRWTFQEACLATQFSFLLKDTIINPRRWVSEHSYPLDRSRSAFERGLRSNVFHSSMRCQML